MNWTDWYDWIIKGMIIITVCLAAFAVAVVGFIMYGLASS